MHGYARSDLREAITGIKLVNWRASGLMMDAYGIYSAGGSIIETDGINPDWQARCMKDAMI